MHGLRAFDIILNSAGFDPAWYDGQYPDALRMGMSPQQHYEAFGYRLGRGLSAAQPRLEPDTSLARALARTPVISYCTPIMNRPDDIRTTLAANLEENRPLQEQVEFVIAFMDEDTETHDWLRETFAEDIASGYLRMLLLPPLESWHFGKAKNMHRPYARGAVYSSLDGDNFVTLEETRQLLEVHEAHPEGFVFHHFTGSWGDGSSGRISMPIALYREFGYDESFMPRQYDEMDVLLTALCADPDLPFVRLRTDNHGFSSKRSVRFMEEAAVGNPILELDAPRHVAPANPKDEGYVQADRSMAAMTSFNQGLCFMKNARTPKMRTTYLELAIAGRHRVIDTVPREKILATLFHMQGVPDPATLEIGPEDVCIFACMKNDDLFLPDFYAHHKALGVAHFFIVDDGSDVPIGQTLPHDDVHVFRPKVGNFVTAKGLWMEGLMKAYLDEGQWALTLDADEFLDLPEGCETLPALGRLLAERGQDLQAALLVDLVPRPDVTPEELDRVETDFLSIFDHHVYIDSPIAKTYAQAGSIKWAFGPYAQLSWHLDTRYHGFGTFDALRKIPLIRHQAGRHLNQGFHTLHYTDGRKEPGHEIWDTDLVITLRHFKLLKLFSTTARTRMAAQVASAQNSQYHARTTANIAKIFGDGGEDKLHQILALPSRPLADSVLRGLKPMEFRQKTDRKDPQGTV
ncbi:glycosyltransferase family 2 protein [Pseudooceanicola nanhaiensis]|uniref:glycosyltransferase family 2 protein n=1 Tax=Pseudooceanicola nanhaiensis TaxID=375761 RepID=UPI001CD42DBE|nr:glycosyltransferase family 2 protein [Pseudooceanicola nanhaiensis]MCA0922773.1 glycosyltransferase family 2 protein [Pseudooceanicola nanhaiensis]